MHLEGCSDSERREVYEQYLNCYDANVACLCDGKHQRNCEKVNPGKLYRSKTLYYIFF